MSDVDPRPPGALSGSAASSGARLDSPALRQAQSELLSVALIDARNLTLQRLLLIEQAQAAAGPAAGVPASDFESPLWIAGHIGWFSECWIGRNTQRALGPTCPREPTRIGSIEPQADAFWDPAQRPPVPDAAPVTDGPAVRAYLLETLETTLALLGKMPEDDDALYFFRAALAHEDDCGEQMLVAAQTLGLALPIAAPSGLHLREPVVCPAMRWQLGTSRGGYVPDLERGADEIALPEFEIDAQPVTWAQFIEFVDDGGYDREELWRGAGWGWLQAQAQQAGRRAPRHVEQIGAARFGGSGAVQQHWFGRGQRMAGNQQVMHVNAFEADAWARWAGRRLPSEVEWEAAAHVAVRRGFQWGGVHEWTATTLRPWPGYRTGPLGGPTEALFGRARVLRGASFATTGRQRDAKFRRCALPTRDDGFFGFRTCGL